MPTEKRNYPEVRIIWNKWLTAMVISGILTLIIIILGLLDVMKELGLILGLLGILITTAFGTVAVTKASVSSAVVALKEEHETTRSTLRDVIREELDKTRVILAEIRDRLPKRAPRGRSRPRR